MKTPSQAWSNTYKFRLWLGSLDHELLNDRQKRELQYFAGWGPRGCSDWNYKLQLIFHRSKRTIQYDLRHLEKHSLIDIRGALGKHRRIIALPFPNKAAWMAASIQQMLQNFGKPNRQIVRNRGAKNCTHERRTKRHSINQQRNELLFGRPPKPPKAESGTAPDRATRGGRIPPHPPGGSGGRELDQAQLRKDLIDRLLFVGHNRARAIALADIAIEHELRKRRP